jgi:hypothetical protein
VLSCLLALLVPSWALGESLDIPALVKMLTLSEDDKADLLAGKVITREPAELSDKELAAAVVMVIPRSVNEIQELLQSDKVLEAGRLVLNFKNLGSGPPSRADFDGIKFEADEAEEIDGLLEAKVGSDFNLHASEIERFEALRDKFSGKCSRDPECSEAVTAAYRDILFERAKAYHEKGLAGVLPYSRGGRKVAEPAVELKAAIEAAEYLEMVMPAVYGALADYPTGKAEGVDHRLYWIKQTVQGRPAIILAHRMFYFQENQSVALERQFYAGFSYNSLQIQVAAFPVEGKTAVVYLNRTSTDQVAGFGSGMRHSIGRKQMIKEVKANFETARKRLPAGS